MTEYFKVSKTLLDNILKYLAQKPYQEVALLIHNIQNDVVPIEEKNDSKITNIKEKDKI